jgi:FixJ family two-component response regulator
VEFLTKPFGEQDLLEAVQRAINKHRQTRDERTAMNALQRRYDLLTPREREVFSLVAGGLLNKQIAAELGASEKTIKVHRGQLMQKMEANSLADLIRMAGELGVRSPKS